jgi:hypothetical protein
MIKLDETVIKEPTDMDFEWYRLTKSGRLASGRMTMELIAKKRKFLFSYEVLSGTDLDTVLSFIFGDANFFKLTYSFNGKLGEAVVYAGSIKAKKFRVDGIWYWKNVTFDLIEQ